MLDEWTHFRHCDNDDAGDVSILLIYKNVVNAGYMLIIFVCEYYIYIIFRVLLPLVYK